MDDEVDSPSTTPAASSFVADSIKVLTASSPSDLIEFGDELSKTYEADMGHAEWAFRGQSKTFGTLVPSFQRRFHTRKSIKTAEFIEAELIKAFRNHYAGLSGSMRDMPLPSAIGAGKELRCLSVMQHYGVPTRLLDWTANFWIAMYFACAGDPEEDGELWLYERQNFRARSGAMRLAAHIYGSTDDSSATDPPILQRPDLSLVLEISPTITPRMKQQDAHHTVASNVFSDQAEIIHQMLKSPSDSTSRYLQRVVVAKGAKEKVLRYLNEHKDISAGTLFPDFEGLGRFLRWQLDSLITTLL